MSETKVCTKCGEGKPLAEFGVTGNARRCRKCRGLTSGSYRERWKQEKKKRRKRDREKERKRRNAARRQKRTVTVVADFSNVVLLEWTVIYEVGNPGKYPFWWGRDISIPDLAAKPSDRGVYSCYLKYAHESAFAEAYELVTGKRLYEGTNRIVKFFWMGRHIATMHHDNVLILSDGDGKSRGIAKAKYKRPNR